MQTRRTKTAPRRLWDVQKQEREERILEAAAELFRERGFEGTSMEAIAERAGLAVGTVYNYFASKTALLLRVVLRGRAASLAQLALTLDKLPEDPQEALCGLLLAQMRGALRHDKRLWRVVHATTASQADSFGREYLESRKQLIDLTIGLLDGMKRTGLIAMHVSTEHAARVVGTIGAELFRTFVSNDAATLDELEAELRPRIGVIVNGLRPR